MIKKDDDIYSMKLGEITNFKFKDIPPDIIKPPYKCVSRGVTLQNNEGIQFEFKIKDKAFIKDEHEYDE